MTPATRRALRRIQAKQAALRHGDLYLYWRYSVGSPLPFAEWLRQFHTARDAGDQPDYTAIAEHLTSLSRAGLGHLSGGHRGPSNP